MKKTFLVLCLILLSTPAFAAKAQANKYFDSLTVALERNYALNDTVEFSVFDLSEMQVINDDPDIKDLVTAPESVELPTESQIAPVFKDFARYFYANLKKQILEQQVPVTLTAGNLPDYAKPLSLSIKVNQVHFKALQADKKGYKFLPVVVNVSGEIKDKFSDELLFSFTDSVETMLPTDASKPEDVLNQAAGLLMKDFALFLKSQY